MAATAPPAVPHCREDPPWSECGDPKSAEFGNVFAAPAANGALALFFDRKRRRHALTAFEGRSVGGEVVIYGRRFTVVRVEADR
jgi:hypothetical protein